MLLWKRCEASDELTHGPGPRTGTFETTGLPIEIGGERKKALAEGSRRGEMCQFATPFRLAPQFDRTAREKFLLLVHSSPAL